jgi:hypothetical protein
LWFSALIAPKRPLWNPKHDSGGIDRMAAIYARR